MRLGMMILARALALLWAGFWLFFFVAESLAWHTPWHVTAAWTALGVLFVLLAVAPWRWEATGGALLIAAGAAAGVAYAIWPPAGLPLSARLATDLAFCGPPVVAGILFLMHRR